MTTALAVGDPSIPLRDEDYPNLFLSEGQSIYDLAPRDLCRVLCCYIIMGLNDSSLKEAWESLTGIHKWQRELDNISYLPRDDGAFVPVSHITEIPNEPFRWD